MFTKTDNVHVAEMPTSVQALLRSPLLRAECVLGTQSYLSNAFATNTSEDVARENLGICASVTDPEKRGAMVLSYSANLITDTANDILSVLPFVQRTEGSLISSGTQVDPLADPIVMPHMSAQFSFQGAILVDTTPADLADTVNFTAGIIVTLASATGTFTTTGFASARLYEETPSFFQPNKG